MNYIDELNEPQREAVLTINGPVMIIAGAGSGKTRVLTYRIAYLIEQGVDPFNILSLTFTNKAAREMRKRIEKVAGTNARNLWMGTFHSVFARILRSEAEKIGYTNNFTIYDTDDCKSLIKTIVGEMQLDDKVYKPSSVLGRISSAKNKLISPREYVNNAILRADDESAMRPKLGEIYKIYQERCFKAGAMDFDDLLFNTNILFRDHLDVLNKYQNRFKYVMVDEFQDTNLSQYLITRKLAARHQNICVVGDDAQSIYAFRGADIQNILNFEKDYPDLKVVKLEENYRSTQMIVKAANSIISHNKAQLRKSVFTSNEDGALITLLKASSDNEEGKLIAHSIFEDKTQKQLVYNNFAILYRTNSQSRSMEEGLRKLNIPYRLVGGVSFYQRKEIKDLVSYLRYAMNHNDEEALKRIINYPKRGIGDTTIAKIILFADEQGITLWEVISNISKFMSGRTADLIDQFAIIIKSFKLIIETKDAFEAASHIAKVSGILKELYDDKTVEGLARYENLQALLNAVKEYVDSEENEDKSLGAFLQEIALVTDARDDKDADDDKVTLMTIHSSKGLEFKNVYIVGVEEDLFPSQMMISSREDLEEERRLFYVAVTRAETKLTLSYATTRYRFGRLKPCEPSRFLTEIDSKYISTPQKSSGFIDSEDGASFARLKLGGVPKPKPSPTPGQMAAKPYTPSANFAPSPTAALAAGQRIEHQKFGMGTILELDNSGNDGKAKVSFDNFGEKTLLLSFAKLMIV
jgi:DNA helicase-2/ATP-dependent DNA helicase PcrA